MPWREEEGKGRERPEGWLVGNGPGMGATVIYALQLEGFTLELFARGLPELEKSRQQRPDAVILDVGPLELSGSEL
ncbi:hypothetical protein [Salmonella enterica]|uniref:hypothetical protein n=1 Tax=Salmonella enterica TaxID=28901 RepID=UPI00398C6DBA